MRTSLVVVCVLVVIGSMMTQFIVSGVSPRTSVAERGKMYPFCFVRLGEASIENCHGSYVGAIVDYEKFIWFGFGALSCDLIDYGNSSAWSLRVSRFHRIMDYKEDVRIVIRGFIGFFDLAGNLGCDDLRGFALQVRVTPLSAPHGQTRLVASILGGYSGGARIKNVGNEPADNVTYVFTITGERDHTINQTICGTYSQYGVNSVLSPKETFDIFSHVQGFGPVEMTLIVTASNAASVQQSRIGFQKDVVTWVPGELLAARFLWPPGYIDRP